MNANFITESLASKNHPHTQMYISLNIKYITTVLLIHWNKENIKFIFLPWIIISEEFWNYFGPELNISASRRILIWFQFHEIRIYYIYYRFHYDVRLTNFIEIASSISNRVTMNLLLIDSCSIFFFASVHKRGSVW